MRWINLTTVDDSFQAQTLKEMLAEEGIECIVVNEYSNTILPIPGHIGNAIQVRVADVDFEIAQKILDKLKADTDQVVCPNCGSLNVSYGWGVKNAMKRVFAFFLLILFMIPLHKINLAYKCRDCGAEFGKNKF